ncbi:MULTISPECIES: Spy/CpxP family protein refolding chaperone [Hwangdonia]|uniref:Spy/CpxP family protein refolding chaperone n=1 Tax=Hwangdonia seohaensis TaxID=1240727 RepID=A0ABW3RDB4_9FLAO|nr:Spy/CpxP family protein refolding chaperone [Hwangdonia seohaensis]
MKKIAIIAVALLALQATAQEQKREHANKERGDKMIMLSPEEIATLQTKKMTLHLDLNESQQAKIQKINLENATKRKAMMEARKAKKESGNAEKPTKEERYAMMNAKLDHQIAMKAKMKDILNNEQYAKWEKGQAKKMHKNKYRKKGHGKKKQQ